MACCASPARAQAPPHWQHYSSLDGLPESWIADVTIGPSGRSFITHGTVATMSVYDGFTFTLLPSPGANLTVREGPDGVLWALMPGQPVGTGFQGVQAFDGTSWLQYPLPEVTPFARARRNFLPWGPARVLVITPERLLEFDQPTGRTLELLTARAAGLGPFLGCAPSAAGAWIVSANGVLHLQAAGTADRSWRFPPSVVAGDDALPSEDVDGSVVVSLGASPLPGTSARVIRIGPSGTAVLASSDARAGTSMWGWPGVDGHWWLARVHDNMFDLSYVSPDRRSDAIPRTRSLSGQWSAVTPDGAGGMWISTALGLVRHVPAVWREPPLLESPTVATGGIVQTRSGDLVTLRAGQLLQSRDGLTWSSHAIPSDTDVTLYLPDALVELRDGRLAFGHGAGLPTFDPATGRFDLDARAIADASEVSVVNATRDGGVWVVANPRNGPAWLEAYGARPRPRIMGPQGWVGAAPRAVLETAAGDLYVIPDGDGVGRVRGDTVEHLGPAQGYPGRGPFCGAEIRPGVLWFGDRDGVIEFDGSSWRTVRTGLQTVRSISLGRDGTVWVASGTGLHRYKDGSWLTMTSADGLPDGALIDVLEDAAGRLWATTSAGLSVYHPEADCAIRRTRSSTPPSTRARFPRAARRTWSSVVWTGGA